MIKEMLRKFLGLVTISLIVTLVLVGSSGASVRKAIPFEVYSLKGEKIEVDFRKDFTLLLFIDSDCLECLYRFLELEEEVSRFGGKVQIFPVCSDCDWRKLLQLNQAVNSEIFFVSKDLKVKWGVWETPTFFLVDSAARVLAKWEKEIPFKELEKTIATYSTDKKNTLALRKENSSSCSGTLCY